MDLDHAESLARSLMAHHGVDSWGFRWDRARRRAGQTNFTDREITLSRHMTQLCTEEQVTDTILHEIAHVLAGPGHGHDKVWKQQALAIGARPRAHVAEDFPKVPGTWKAICPNGHVHYRYRKPTRPVSCGRCSRRYSPAYGLNWTKVSQ